MPRSLLTHLTLRTWLERWSQEAIDQADAIGLEVSEGMRRSGWIGAAPVGQATIARTETRLGQTLPPTLREFYTVTDGWPTLSMDFAAIRAVEDLGWTRDLDPDLIKAWDDAGSAWPPDADDGPPLLRRSLLLNTGTDRLLLDPARTTNGEWTAVGFTSWYPGAGEPQPSFRAELEDHYATFLNFDAPGSRTHAEIADQVEHAYQLLLNGNRDEEDVFEQAGRFGDERAQVLAIQVTALTGNDADHSELIWRSRTVTGDAAVQDDLLPLLVIQALDPAAGQEYRMTSFTQSSPPEFASMARQLAVRYRFERGLTADFSRTPAFARTVEQARQLVRSGRDDEAFGLVLAGLGGWTPQTGMHLAPLGLLWDKELGPIMTADRRRRLLSQARGLG
ncbi:SMI1/KNR4 family protein [Kineosporia sp. J2-2]|uniref:SMI1/KNR4 family protein n=1 Tax=Kineosporia corallincola TaxID=2835133 RepID=A0ABS5TC51_9ACTN|nr:SMI1/KNR4 family protein [Kineosporia corallincola]MBT0768664.1 SMI1/KNR4 family protein [Kineosporia corallincola]